MRVDEAIYLLAGYGININPNNPVAEAVKMGIEALNEISRENWWKLLFLVAFVCADYKAGEK